MLAPSTTCCHMRRPWALSEGMGANQSVASRMVYDLLSSQSLKFNQMDWVRARPMTPSVAGRVAPSFLVARFHTVGVETRVYCLEERA